VKFITPEECFDGVRVDAPMALRMIGEGGGGVYFILLFKFLKKETRAARGLRRTCRWCALSRFDLVKVTSSQNLKGVGRPRGATRRGEVDVRAAAFCDVWLRAGESGGRGGGGSLRSVGRAKEV
jgi:hypothetical protein